MKRYTLMTMFFLSGVVSLVGSNDAELVKNDRKDQIEARKNAMRDAESIIGQCHEMIKTKQKEYYDNKSQLLQLQLDELVEWSQDDIVNFTRDLQDDAKPGIIDSLIYRINMATYWTVLTKIQLNALQNRPLNELKESIAYYDFCTRFVAFNPENQKATCRVEGWYKDTQSIFWENPFKDHEDCSVGMSKQLFDTLKLRKWSRSLSC